MADSLPLFEVPQLDQSEHPNALTRLIDAQSWLQALPTANPKAAAVQLLSALIKLNRYPGQIGQRDAIMQLLNETFEVLLQQPAAIRRFTDPQLFRNLCLELAYGHKILTNEIIQATLIRRREQALARQLYLVVYHLSHEQQFAFRQYDCNSTDSIRQIMAIYETSRQQGFHLLPQGPRERDSIHRRTGHNLLMLLMNPCGLPLTLMDAAIRVMELVAADLQIEPFQQGIPLKSSQVVMDVESLARPRVLDEIDTARHPTRYRLLDLSTPAAKLQKLLKRHRAAENAEAIIRDVPINKGRRVINEILHAWLVKQDRASTRHPQFGGIYWATGFNDIYPMMKNTYKIEEPDVFSTFVVTMEGDGFSESRPRSTGKQLLSAGQMLNRSVSGVAIRIDLDGNLPEVGEPILLSVSAEPEAMADLSLGIVRRVVKSDEQQLELGIQYIRGIPFAGELFLQDEGRSVQAIWIDRGELENGLCIISDQKIDLGTPFLLQLPDDRRMHLKIDKLLELSHRQIRFRVRLANG
jgi:hypothetical protein